MFPATEERGSSLSHHTAIQENPNTQVIDNHKKREEEYKGCCSVPPVTITKLPSARHAANSFVHPPIIKTFSRFEPLIEIIGKGASTLLHKLCYYSKLNQQKGRGRDVITTANYLAEQLGVSKSTIKRRLAKLRKEKFIMTKKYKNDHGNIVANHIMLTSKLFELLPLAPDQNEPTLLGSKHRHPGFILNPFI